MYTKNEHVRVEAYRDNDYVGNVDDGISISRFYTFVSENLVTLKNKKQNVVFRFSCKAA